MMLAPSIAQRASDKQNSYSNNNSEAAIVLSLRSSRCPFIHTVRLQACKNMADFSSLQKRNMCEILARRARWPIRGEPRISGRYL